MELNFEQTKQNIKSVLEWGLKEFRSEASSERVFTLGLYVSPVFGYLNVAVDTEKASQDFAASFKPGENTDGYLLKDEKGVFNCNCPDFEYFYESEVELDSFRNAYESGEPITVTGGGKSIEYDRNRGDEGFNEILFPFLKDFLIELNDSGYLKSLEIKGARVGVQMFASTLCHYIFTE